MKTKSIMIVALLFLNAVAQPFAAGTLWDWFVVPVTGFKVLSFWNAFGLWLLVSLCTAQWNKSALDQMSDDELFKIRFAKLLTAIFALGLGWVAHACL